MERMIGLGEDGEGGINLGVMGKGLWDKTK